MIPPDAPLTARNAVTIASRVLCGLVLVYAAMNLFALPSYAMGLLHYQAHAEGVASGNYYAYWTSKYVGWIGEALLKTVLYLWAAQILYRCGPRVERFLIGDDLAPPAYDGGLD